MPTATATYNNVTLAGPTDKYQVVEGNVYFPPDSIAERAAFETTSTHTTCPWKGVASYYALGVEGTKVNDVGWYYPEPKSGAAHIKDHVAFYKNKVNVSVQ